MFIHSIVSKCFQVFKNVLTWKDLKFSFLCKKWGWGNDEEEIHTKYMSAFFHPT